MQNILVIVKKVNLLRSSLALSLVMKASGNDLVHQETLSRVAVTSTRRQRTVVPATATRFLMFSLVSEIL